MLVLAYSAYTLFVNGVRLAKDSEARLALQKTLISGTGLLSRELSESNPTSVRSDNFPAGVVFASPRNVNGALTLSGARVSWEKVIGYYVDEDKKLIRKEWLLDPLVRQAGFPPTLGAGFSTADIQNEPLPLRHLTGGIEDFRVELNGNMATVRIQAGQVDSRGREHKVRLQTAVRIQN